MRRMKNPSSFRMRLERVVAIGLVAVACTSCRAASDDARRDKLELALSDENDIEFIRQKVMDRERAFLRALNQSDASASEFMDMSVQFVDPAAAPAKLVNEPRARYRSRGGYFAALNALPRADHSSDKIEIRVERKDYVVAMAVPDQGRPVVTTWVRHREGWKIAVLEVNVPDSYVESIRKIHEDVHH